MTRVIDIILVEHFKLDLSSSWKMMTMSCFRCLPGTIAIVENLFIVLGLEQLMMIWTSPERLRHWNKLCHQWRILRCERHWILIGHVKEPDGSVDRRVGYRTEVCMHISFSYLTFYLDSYVLKTIALYYNICILYYYYVYVYWLDYKSALFCG